MLPPKYEILKSKNRIALIACDISPTRGEGRLARAFLAGQGIAIGETPADCFFLNDKWVTSPSKLLPSFLLRTGVCFWLIFCIIWCRLRQYETVYILNYLSLWNFTVFLFAPRDAVFAPVTGSGPINPKHIFAPFHRQVQTRFLRNIILPILCKISAKIIKWRRLRYSAATPFVAAYFKEEKAAFYYISCILDISHQGRTQPPDRLDVDLLLYTTKHSLKNNALLTELLPHLSRAGLKCSVIDPQMLVPDGPTGYDIHRQLPHGHVIDLIMRSKAVLVISLEGAGLFAQEAALLGRKVFCFPDTGAAKLPGAVCLAQRMVRPSLPSITDVIKDNIDLSPDADIQEQMRELIGNAKAFFFARHRSVK